MDASFHFMRWSLVQECLATANFSNEFITKIEQTKLDEDEILVSFDVVSLFTNVPVDEACNIAKERLLNK